MVHVAFSLLINFKAWVVIALAYKQTSTYLLGIYVQTTIYVLKSSFDQCPVNTVQMNNLQKLQNHLFGKLQIYYQTTGVLQSMLIMWKFLKRFISEGFYFMEDMWLIQMRSNCKLLIHTDEKPMSQRQCFSEQMFTNEKKVSTF